jgi:hypothetical protein
MKVFGIGIQKTGTTTLGWCLGQMGFKHRSYHPMAAWYFRLNRHDRLRQVMDAYDSFDDEPWAHTYVLADQWYPDAKFVLTVRKNAGRWAQSLVNHCDRVPFNEHRRFFLKYMMPRGHEMELIEHYHRHIAEVQAYFRERPDKLLVMCWENGDGWAQLCPFLGRPLLDLPIFKANARPERNYPPQTAWRVLKNMPRYYLERLRTEIGSRRIGRV